MCFAFNAGKCKGTTCPRGFEHRCSICGAEHAAFAVAACRDKVDGSGRPIKYKKGKKAKGGK